MLDIVESVPPTDDGLSVVTLVEFKRHINISSSSRDNDLEECIREAAAALDWTDGELNRSIFPRTITRYLRKFPDRLDDRGRVTGTRKGIIQLPYPPFIELVSLSIEDGSPSTEVDSDLYVVKDGTLVPELELVANAEWPQVTEGPRAIAVTYRAGYEEYPAMLKRYVKILAAHYFENKEATINDPRVLQVNRRTEFGLTEMRRKLRIPVSYDGWGE